RAMVFEISENQRNAGGGEATPDPLLSAALGKSLRAVDQEHSGLVHQPAGLVGTSDSGMVPPESEVRGQRSEVRNLCWIEAAEGPGELGSGQRHPRHLVFVMALGLRDDGPEDAEEILSHEHARDWAGHYFLLGCANDFCRT